MWLPSGVSLSGEYRRAGLRRRFSRADVPRNCTADLALFLAILIRAPAASDRLFDRLITRGLDLIRDLGVSLGGDLIGLSSWDRSGDGTKSGVGISDLMVTFERGLGESLRDGVLECILRGTLRAIVGVSCGDSTTLTTLRYCFELEDCSAFSCLDFKSMASMTFLSLSRLFTVSIF